MAPTITASGQVLAKAGTNHSTDFDTGWTTGSEYDSWIEEAEAFLCNLVKYDIVSNWASLSAIYKLMFTEYCSRSAAIDVILYDTAGYATDEDSARVVSENMINVHIFKMQQIEKLLSEADVQDFMAV